MTYQGFPAITPIMTGAQGDGVTDDTVAIQQAYNLAQRQAAITGQAMLVFPSGYTFKYQRINTTTGGVDIWAYGSRHIPIGSALTSGMYLPTLGSTVARFAIRGGTWAGTGNETQPLFFGGNGDATVDVLFRDMYITNWGVGPLYMYNVARAITVNNTIENVTGTLNCINHVFGGTGTIASQILSHGNIVQNCTGGAIAIVQDAASNPPANFEIQGTISDNICDGATFQLAGSIDIEADSATAAAYGRLVICGNHVTNRTPSGNAFGITAEAEFADVLIANNTIEMTSSSGYAFLTSGAGISVVNNRVKSANVFFTSPTEVLASGNILSTGPSQGRVVLVAGAATVTTAEVQANDNIILSRVVAGGTLGELSVGTITAGTSFGITSSSGTDTSTIYWRIDH